MTVVEHLAELRRRLFISLIAVALAAIVCFIFSNSIISFLVHYYKTATHGRQKQLVFTGPLDAFLVRLKVATYGGITLAVPVWMWQLWRFVTPGLNKNEKRYAIPFIISTVLLFALGGWVALLTLSKALEFLINVGGSSLHPLLAADKYLSLVGLMVLAFGLAFEFPVVLMFLLLARVLNTGQLRRWRRAAIVTIVIFAAVITPSQDPYSLFFMAVPMYIFYETCILLGRVLKR
ncbi:MAG: twin-arginine translocase subunit TatC [Actinobacteria bacterium]|nr:twin-arginine translocase subunit TatC [Actinomycetota bacterium]